MKDQSFEIKVSDLLNHIANDEIIFDKKFTNLIPNLSDDWISWKVKLSWIDDENVLVELEYLHCELNEVCDCCTNSFKRNVDVYWYSSRFTMNKEERDYANDEVLFFIDKVKYTINIEELVYQAIQLESPFVLYCPDCAKNHENLESTENLEELYEDAESWDGVSNIIFHK